MHELSIAQFMVEEASRAAGSVGARTVRSVTARIGVLAGVVPQALVFSWDIAAEGTICAGSSLLIDEVPIRVRCPQDGQVHTLSQPRFRCPVCDAPTTDLVSGRELELASLEWLP